MTTETVVAMVVTAIVAGPVGLAAGLLVTRRFQRAARDEAARAADELRKAGQLEAEGIVKEAKIAAKDELLRLRDEFERTTRDARAEQQEVERKLKSREEKLDHKLDDLQRRFDEVAARDRQLTLAGDELKQRRHDLEQAIQQALAQLEDISQMTKDQARDALLKRLDEELTHERGAMIRRSIEELKQGCEREGKKLMIQAMQRYAGECAYEHTTCTVPLPSDEMKGRIIGREGRNIRVFEAQTGVNVLIDDTPSAVVISCFEPVRREVARLALERLVADGRIHPTRVEEVIAKAQSDVQSEIAKAGEEALHRLQVSGVAPGVVEVLGRLKYRFSYTQNVLEHCVEVANFMAMLAAELRLDVVTAKRIGLFHDIGKALDHEKEGSHAALGMEFLKRHGEAPLVVNGVGCHHDEVPAESPLGALISICDTLSASRPGARSETTDIYLKRLEQLEGIGRTFPGVDTCYAVQAGREVRVVVEPQTISEDQANKLARDIALRVEGEMQYPGQIKVCVIRETRSVEYAK